MVCYNHKAKFQQGAGAIDSIMKVFTVERYPNERHARSLAPATFLQPMSFMGPHSDLSRRLDTNEQPLPDSQFVNESDRQSYIHDLAYKHAKDDYMKNPTPQNHKVQMQKVWNADEKFINAMDHDNEEPMAKVAGKLIQLKRAGEKVGVLPSSTFSGFGTEQEADEVENKDPVARLRDLVQKDYMTQERKNRKLKAQKGGVLPLIPIGVAIASTLGSKLVSDIYDFVKKKITSGGGGMVPYHRTLKEKKLYLKDFANSI